jgi:hypothetical protein
MPEALTESFCERCGTRYEFAARSRLTPLRKTRGLISGLRNYLMSQDALRDAVGDAMRDEEESLASHQLEAFHESFNFCIDCRQYTCVNCWNDGAGRCRTCQPIPGTDDLLERFEASFQAQHPELAEQELQRRMGVEAWPTSDLVETAADNGHLELEWSANALNGASDAAAEWPTAEPIEPEPEQEQEPMVAETALFVTDAEPAFAVEEPPEVAAEPEPVAAVAEPEPEPVAAVAEPEPEPVAAVAEPEPEHEVLLPVVHGIEVPEPVFVITWEEDTAFELEPEPEPVAAVVEPEPEPEPVAAVVEPEPEPEPVAAVVEPEPEPEPVAAVVEPEPEPEPVAPPVTPVPIRPVSETLVRISPPQPVAPVVPAAPPAPSPEELRVAAQADDAEVAARRAKLELLGLGDPGEGPVSQRPAVLPYRSSGAAAPIDLSAAARARGMSASAALWDASAREVAAAVSAVGVQACAHCGLSLSATARFCRRCGTRQAQPA